MTKPSYEELERLDAELHAYIDGRIAHDADVLITCKDAWQLRDVIAELASVRRLLQRGVEYIKQYGCSDSKCRDAGHVEMKQWLAESADIGKLDAADKSVVTAWGHPCPTGSHDGGRCCQACDHGYPVTCVCMEFEADADESEVEMGKVNRVDEKGDRCEYQSAAWRCTLPMNHSGGHSPFTDEFTGGEKCPDCQHKLYHHVTEGCAYTVAKDGKTEQCNCGRPRPDYIEKESARVAALPMEERCKLAGSAETGGEKAAPKYEGMLPDLRPRYGWMDSVDFDHELGNALGGNVVYPTKENLYENRKCLDTDGHCTGIRVVIFSLETPHLYWQGNAETHLGCGHSKWDSRRDCITCLQSAVDYLNHQLANSHRSSQNQTVSGGVEGAHEGTTADKSGKVNRVDENSETTVSPAGSSGQREQGSSLLPPTKSVEYSSQNQTAGSAETID